jgi:putative ABC transport system permease protein
MRRLRALLLRLAGSFGIRVPRSEFSDDDIRRELESHIELHTAENIRRGMAPADARRQALVAAAGVTRAAESMREQYRFVSLEQVVADIRYALRGFARSPAFAITAIVTLALGIGANAAMFGVVDHLMFRAHPYLRDPGAVHRIYFADTRDRGRVIRPGGVEYLRYLDMTRHTSSFSRMAVFAHPTVALGEGDAARERRIAVVSGTFWDFFDARPALGRFFTPDEDVTPRGADVTVLGFNFWQTEFGGRDVLGKRLIMGTMSLTIVGVAPPRFTGVLDVEEPAAYVPVTLYAATYRPADPTSYYTDYSWGWLSIMARRKPGVPIAQATADASRAYWGSWEAERAQAGAAGGIAPAEIAKPVAIVSAMKTAAGPDPALEERTTLWLMGVAGIVLLIACANVANLLLARAIRRQREIALRLALGASRRRLAAQTLTESLLLSLLGSIAGLLVAQWAGAVIRRTLVATRNVELDVFTDWRTLVVVGGIAVIASAVTGLVPAVLLMRGDLAPSLKAGAREGTYRRSRTRAALLVAQGALSVVLLVGAALFVSSLNRVRAMRMGYDAENALIVYRNLRGVRLDSAQLVAQRRTLLQTAQAIPGVTHAAWMSSVPFWSTASTSLFVPGIDSVSRLGQFSYQLTTANYFNAMGTRLLRGRGITEQDDAAAPRVAVVSESMARALWPGEEALGKCIKVRSDTMPCTTVVGVAEDIVQRENQLGDSPRLHYYLPLEQVNPQSGMYLVLRTHANVASQIEPVRKSLQAIMQGRSYVTVRPLMEGVEGAQRSWRLGATLFVAFGLLALVVAAVGLYGVVTYNVTQRMHELGIRVALGAGRGNIVRLVMGQSTRLALGGVIIGFVLALSASRFIEPLLYRQSATDPTIYAAVCAIILTVAVLAAAAPALRATRVDPNSALSAE